MTFAHPCQLHISTTDRTARRPQPMFCCKAATARHPLKLAPCAKPSIPSSPHLQMTSSRRLQLPSGPHAVLPTDPPSPAAAPLHVQHGVTANQTQHQDCQLPASAAPSLTSAVQAAPCHYRQQAYDALHCLQCGHAHAWCLPANPPNPVCAQCTPQRTTRASRAQEVLRCQCMGCSLTVAPVRSQAITTTVTEQSASHHQSQHSP